jgi:hypothetical protein
MLQHFDDDMLWDFFGIDAGVTVRKSLSFYSKLMAIPY